MTFLSSDRPRDVFRKGPLLCSSPYEHAPNIYAPRLDDSHTDCLSVGRAPVRRAHVQGRPRTPPGAFRNDHANGGRAGAWLIAGATGVQGFAGSLEHSRSRFTSGRGRTGLLARHPESPQGRAGYEHKKSSATDADILWYGIDRVVHTKTGGGHEKVDTYKDLGEALGKFQALRATMIEYIKTTSDDMRAHSFGDREVIDCWQWMLEISTHAERHIQQIREIKNDPNFPTPLCKKKWPL
jgi:hypothetical protein